MKEKKKMHPALRTLTYIKPHWYLIVASTVAGVIKLTLPLILPQVLKYFTDVLLPATNTLSNAQKLEEIYKWLFILLFIYIFLYIPATFVRDSGAQEVSNRVMPTMRCELYDHLLHMSARFHQEHKSGSIVTRINRDVEQVHSVIWSVATNI